eukprot:12564433-Heterocapsa_arctica.AAC.1
MSIHIQHIHNTYERTTSEPAEWASKRLLTPGTSQPPPAPPPYVPPAAPVALMAATRRNLTQLPRSIYMYTQLISEL